MANNTENVTTKFRVDISDLKKGITEANKQIKLANAEFKNATAGMDKWSESADGLTAKIAQQNKIVDAEKTKLDLLRQQLERLNKSQENGEKTISNLTAKYNDAVKTYGATSDEAKKYAKQLTDAQAAQERNAKAAEDLNIKILNQDTAVKNAQAQVNRYENALDDLNKELNEDSSAAANAGKSFDEIGDSAEDAGKKADNAGNGGFTVFKQVLANLTTQVINKAVDALKDVGKELVNVVTSSAEAGDRIDKMSQKIGISAESFQEWEYVFERSGASIDGLEGSIKKLSTVITDAANGSDSAKEKLNAVGLSIDDLNGKSQDEQLSIVIGKLQEMGSSSERTAAASKLLGRSATDLGAVLNMTAEDTEELKKEARDYGMIMSDEAVKSSAEFEDSLTRIQGTVNGVKYSLSSELLPDVTSVMDSIAAAVAGKKGIDGVLNDVGKIVEKRLPKLLNLLTGFGKSLSATIKKGMPKLIKIISSSAPEIIKTASELLINVGSALISSAPDLIKTVLQIVKDLITLLAEQLPAIVDGVVAVIPDIVQALTDPEMMGKMLNASIALMMALVEAIPVVINALIPQLPVIVENVSRVLIDNAPLIIQASFTMFMEIVKAIPLIIGELIPALGKIIESIYNNFIEPVKNRLGALWEDIKTIFKPVQEWFKSKFDAAYSAVTNAFTLAGEFFTGIWGKIKSAFDGVKTFFKDTFADAWENVKSAFSSVGEFFGGIWDTIKEKFTNVGTQVGDAIGGAFKTAINSVIETVENALNGIPDAVNGMIDEINKLPGVEIGQIPTVSLPRLAKGGIIDRPTIAEIGEAGREAILPLERNKAGLRQIASLLANEINSGAMTAGKTTGGNTYNFNQTNNSPKALSRFEIYRQTKNLINAVKGV